MRHSGTRLRHLSPVLLLAGVLMVGAHGCASIDMLPDDLMSGSGDAHGGLPHSDLPDASQIANDEASALFLEAVALGRLDVAMVAIDRGARIEAREPSRLRTAAMIAADRGDLDALMLLMAFGADLAARSEEGWMALHHGAASDRAHAIRLMIAGGADAEGREPAQGMTPLMIASLLANTDAVAALIDGGASPDTAAADGSTALHFAAASHDRLSPMVMAELLVRDADPDQARTDGWTPLMVAAASGNRDSADLLLSFGADPTIESADGATAVDIAAELGDEDLVRLLQTAMARPRSLVSND